MTKQYDNFADLITFTRASTGTYLDSDGLLKTATTNTPRIEFDINGNRKGLLIEEARTNLLLRSEEFDNGNWGKNNATVTPDTVVSPDGLQSADALIENSVNSAHYIQQFASFTSGTVYTLTLYAKQLGTGSQRFLQLAVGSNAFSGFPFANFDLVAGTITASGSGNSAVSSIENVGNGWYRCRLTATADGTVGSAVFPLLQASPSAGRFGGYQGDGASGLLLWGAQLEAGSFPTSYISTAGVAASRSADVASIPTSAFGYNADKGTVVCEFDLPYNDFERRIYVLGVEGSVSNRVMDVYRTPGANPRVAMFNGSTNVTPATGPVPSPSKVGSVYKSADYALMLNGGTIATSTTATVNTPNTLAIGRLTNGSAFACGHIKSLAYYPRKLTPAQLQRLTS